jgi:hypothetical protein
LTPYTSLSTQVESWHAYFVENFRE